MGKKSEPVSSAQIVSTKDDLDRRWQSVIKELGVVESMIEEERREYKIGG
jgi:hypothetical protein